jgi:hypothetical protein
MKICPQVLIRSLVDLSANQISAEYHRITYHNKKRCR